MQYSGILVRLRPDDWDTGRRRLAALPDIEVHHEEAETGRIIVVVESDGLSGHENALKAIRDLPGVILAEPVYHYAPESGTLNAETEREEDPS